MSERGGGFGSLDGAALAVASMIGAGIFVVPSMVAATAGSPGLILAFWVAGGLLALAGALCYAELATRFRRGGAEYVYIREAFGETAGFLSGWTSFVAGFSGAIAAASVAFGEHVTHIVPVLARMGTWTAAAGPLTVTVSGATVVAVGLIAAFTLVGVAGIGASRMATNGLVVLIVIGIAALTVAGFGGPKAVSAVPMVTGGTLVALVPIFFTYSGWNAAAYVAGEFRDPARNIPRALVLGVLVVTALYVGLNATLLRLLSPAGLAASATPMVDAAGILFGAAGGAMVSALILVALASSVCALVITGPRIYHEMAKDGGLPPVFAASSRRDGAPTFASIAQSVWSVLLVVTGTFAQIVTYTGFAIVVFSGAAVCAVIVLRRRHGKPATFGVPAYPFLPLAFIGTMVFIAIASFRYAPGPSLVGLALITAGLPVRLLSGSRRMATWRIQPGPAE